MNKYRAVIICMLMTMALMMAIYSIAQVSPGAPAVNEPVGVPARIVVMEQHISDLRTYCLDSAYQRRENYQDSIIHYSSVSYTHINLASGNTAIVDWLPTVQAALDDVNSYIAILEAH